MSFPLYLFTPLFFTLLLHYLFHLLHDACIKYTKNHEESIHNMTASARFFVSPGFTGVGSLLQYSWLLNCISPARKENAAVRKFSARELIVLSTVNYLERKGLVRKLFYVLR